jgi:hypothetical protein
MPGLKFITIGTSPPCFAITPSAGGAVVAVAAGTGVAAGGTAVAVAAGSGVAVGGTAVAVGRGVGVSSSPHARAINRISTIGTKIRNLGLNIQKFCIITLSFS